MTRADRDSLRADYRMALRKAAPWQTCAMTGVKLPKGLMHPHHPHGRHGAWVLVFVWLTPDAHEWIHANPDEAYARGWLQPEYRGYPPPETPHPKPWMEGKNTARFI